MDLRTLFIIVAAIYVVHAADEDKRPNPIIQFFEAPLKALRARPGEGVAIFEPQVNGSGIASGAVSWLQRLSRNRLSTTTTTRSPQIHVQTIPAQNSLNSGVPLLQINSIEKNPQKEQNSQTKKRQNNVRRNQAPGNTLRFRSQTANGNKNGNGNGNKNVNQNFNQNRPFRNNGFRFGGRNPQQNNGGLRRRFNNRNPNTRINEYNDDNDDDDDDDEDFANAGRKGNNNRADYDEDDEDDDNNMDDEENNADDEENDNNSNNDDGDNSDDDVNDHNNNQNANNNDDEYDDDDEEDDNNDNNNDNNGNEESYSNNNVNNNKVRRQGVQRQQQQQQRPFRRQFFRRQPNIIVRTRPNRQQSQVANPLVSQMSSESTPVRLGNEQQGSFGPFFMIQTGDNEQMPFIVPVQAIPFQSGMLQGSQQFILQPNNNQLSYIPIPLHQLAGQQVAMQPVPMQQVIPQLQLVAQHTHTIQQPTSNQQPISLRPPVAPPSLLNNVQENDSTSTQTGNKKKKRPQRRPKPNRRPPALQNRPGGNNKDKFRPNRRKPMRADSNAARLQNNKGNQENNMDEKMDDENEEAMNEEMKPDMESTEAPAEGKSLEPRQQYFLPQRFFPIGGSGSYLEVSNNGRFLLKTGRELKFDAKESGIEARSDHEVTDLEGEIQAVASDKKSEEQIDSKENIEDDLGEKSKVVAEKVEATQEPEMLVEVKEKDEKVDQKEESQQVNVSEDEKKMKADVSPQIEEIVVPVTAIHPQASSLDQPQSDKLPVVIEPEIKPQISIVNSVKAEEESPKEDKKQPEVPPATSAPVTKSPSNVQSVVKSEVVHEKPNGHLIVKSGVVPKVDNQDSRLNRGNVRFVTG